MSTVTWVAENSALIGWIALGIGVITSILTLFTDDNWRWVRPGGALVRNEAVVGLVLVLVAAILAALGGHGLWLVALGGVLCFSVAVVRWGSALPHRTVAEWRRAEETTRTHLAAAPENATAAGAWEFADFDLFARSMAAKGLLSPVTVYTSVEDDGLLLKEIVVEALRAFDLTVVVEEPVERSSWFQRIWVRAGTAARSEPVRMRLRKLEQALELEHLGKARAEIDLAKASAAAVLLDAVSAQENAVVRIGSLILIKAQGDVAVWTVSELDAAGMENDSALLRDPVSALEYLRKLRGEDGPGALSAG